MEMMVLMSENESKPSNLLNKYMKHLSKTVVKDDNVKKVVFLTGVSAYSDNPINLFLRGPSSIGKTYNVTETLKYFDQEDVWYLGGLSPTALVHDKGILIDENGAEINWSDKPRKEDYKKEELHQFVADQAAWRERLEKSRYIVYLNNRILVFLEAPSFDTFNMLRPLLSHDKWEITYKFTDKTGKGSLRTTSVTLQGWPATTFCTSDIKYIEDLSTRGFTITPEMSNEKYRGVLKMQGHFDAFPFIHLDDREFVELRDLLHKVVHRMVISKGAEQSKEGAYPIIIPYAEKLSEIYPATMPRDMRDFKHFSTLIKISCLLNRFSRPQLEIYNKEGTEVKSFFSVATMQDWHCAFTIFSSLEETTRTGIPGHIINFYHSVVEPLCENGSTRYDELMRRYNEVAERTVSSRTIREWCDLLSKIGFLDNEQLDPDDKRRRLVTALKKQENSAYYGISKKYPFFSEKDAESWWETLKNIAETEKVIIRKSCESKNFITIGELISAILFCDFQPPITKLTDIIPANVEKPQISIIPQKSTFSFDQVVAIRTLESIRKRAYAGFCMSCGQGSVDMVQYPKPIIRYEVTLFNNEKILVCEDCGREIQNFLKEEMFRRGFEGAGA